jgi:hypothetical protein
MRKTRRRDLFWLMVSEVLLSGRLVLSFLGPVRQNIMAERSNQSNVTHSMVPGSREMNKKMLETGCVLSVDDTTSDLLPSATFLHLPVVLSKD